MYQIFYFAKHLPENLENATEDNNERLSTPFE